MDVDVRVVRMAQEVGGWIQQ